MTENSKRNDDLAERSLADEFEWGSLEHRAAARPRSSPAPMRLARSYDLPLRQNVATMRNSFHSCLRMIAIMPLATVRNGFVRLVKVSEVSCNESWTLCPCVDSW